MSLEDSREGVIRLSSDSPQKIHLFEECTVLPRAGKVEAGRSLRVLQGRIICVSTQFAHYS